MPTTKPKASKKTVAKKVAAKKVASKKVVTKKSKPKAARRASKKIAAKKPRVQTKEPRIEHIAVTAPVVEEPVITSTPLVQPVKPVLTEQPVKKISKNMLWLTVAGVTLVIGILWLYSLQFTLPNVSNSTPTFTEANPQVDEFVDTVEEDWGDFQENVDEFENLIDEELTNTNTNSAQPKSKVAPAGQATTDELNNLFSDIN